ncbi:SAR2788 family putative toxin [Bacillus velezensis]|uniref:SAR2788 family putative toxin n=1 Tax=Bacillus velezensis TaxID=492670 RepID=UPI003A8035D0
MKKFLLFFLTLTLLISFSVDVNSAHAFENTNATEKNSAKIIRETKQDLFIKSTYENDHITAVANIKLNKKTNKMDVQVELNNDNGKKINHLLVTSHKLKENIYKATIKDTDKNLVYNIDTSKVHASAASNMKILQYLLKNGEKAAQKKHGKTAVKRAKTKTNFNVMSPYVKINKNKINHIMAKKHNWNKILFKADWPSVQKTLNLTMRFGKETYVNAFFSEKKLKINGHTVVIRYNKLARAESSISTAFVK